MEIGDTAIVTNPARGTCGYVGKIVRISSDTDDLPVVDLEFEEDQGTCQWSYVADEIKILPPSEE